jgi:DNA polymerase III subunit epsilon
VSGSLLERAGTALSAGPRHTLELAREVLGLTGNAPAASAAVLTLLGSDPRFQVDPDGTWRMADGASRPGPALDALSFAVVDVETTGGSYRRGHRVTEVAVVEVAGGEVRGAFRTLVNPGRGIPPRIQALTGITEAMVAGAPFFEIVAPEVAERLAGRVFVAHNASFDWGFVREELLAATGDVPQVERLCTLRLGRLLVPGLRSYALDPLTRHFSIPIHARHRAHGDALATARLLVHLLDRARARGAGDLEALRGLLERRRATG